MARELASYITNASDSGRECTEIKFSLSVEPPDIDSYSFNHTDPCRL